MFLFQIGDIVKCLFIQNKTIYSVVSNIKYSKQCRSGISIQCSYRKGYYDSAWFEFVARNINLEDFLINKAESLIEEKEELIDKLGLTNKK